MEHTLTDESNMDVVSPIFKLPRELRDMIYNYAWNDTGAIMQRYQGNLYKVSYRTPLWETALHMSVPRGTAKWLLTNKQILREGLEQLRREA